MVGEIRDTLHILSLPTGSGDTGRGQVSPAAFLTVPRIDQMLHGSYWPC